MQKFFDYTKRLSAQIAYYDSLAKGKYLESSITNPFAPLINVTIIWIDDNED